jgi:hypothetical protein
MSQPLPAFPVSDITQKVLKNFADMADNVLLAEGCVQKIKGPRKAKTMFAVATLPEAWPKQTPIYNFEMFMGALSLFDKPSLRFNADSVIVTSGDRAAEMELDLRLSDSSTMEDLSNNTLPNDNPAVELTLSKVAIEKILKTTALLKLTHFTIAVDPESAIITAADPKNPLSNKCKLNVTDVVRHDKAFKRSMRFPVSDVQLILGGDYTVAMTAKWTYAYFTNKTLPIAYYIAESR